MKPRRSPPPLEVLTPEEQRRRIEDQALARCEEIKRQRLERERHMKALHKRHKTRFRAQCKTCAAMAFYLDKRNKP